MTTVNISLYLLSIFVAGYSFSITKTPSVFRSTLNIHRLRSAVDGIDADVKKEKEFSFVNDDLRVYAMKLHTKQQGTRDFTPYVKMVALLHYSLQHPERVKRLRYHKFHTSQAGRIIYLF